MDENHAGHEWKDVVVGELQPVSRTLRAAGPGDSEGFAVLPESREFVGGDHAC
jgi:hypothetical protein